MIPLSLCSPVFFILFSYSCCLPAVIILHCREFCGVKVLMIVGVYDVSIYTLTLTFLLHDRIIVLEKEREMGASQHKEREQYCTT
jgi:hypothetical protein